MFEVHDFDILIGHPFEKLVLDISILGELNFRLGRVSLAILITRSKTTIAEPPSQVDQLDDVMVISKDGNRYKISAYPRIPNPTGTNMGLSLCPRARARVQL